MRHLRTLTKKRLAHKTVLLRVDFNIASVDDPFKLERTLPTIRTLLQKGARVILVSHRGRPKSKDRSLRKFSLRVFKPILEKKLRRPVVFLKTIPKELPKGACFLIENLRFFPGEEKNDRAFARKLANLADLYANEAFSNSHRRHASMVAITKELPSYVGPVLEDEIRHLTTILKKPRKPFVLIFGGAKIVGKAHAIRNLLPKASTVLVGSSVIDHPNIGVRSDKIVRPVDWVEDKGRASDIGPLTVTRFSNYIMKAKTIIWAGPLGNTDVPRFRAGSKAIAKAIAKSGAFSVAGGGETTQFIERIGLTKKFSFLSTGGGAMLAFLSGKKLPALEALKKS